MGYEIQKEFHFSASHQLDHLPDYHQCARLHGHNYKLVVVLASNTLNENGFVKDYGELKPLKEYIDNKLDHRHLNELFDFYTTAENMSQYFYNLCKDEFGWDEVVGVSLSETPKTWARYRKE